MLDILRPFRKFMVAVAAVAAMSGPHAQPPARDAGTRHALLIGQSVALSGPAAAVARPYHEGARLYFDRLNAAGGIHGRKVDLLTLDDHGEPAMALANTKKLLDHGVLCLFGYYGSPQVAAAYPLLRDTQALMFAPMAASDTLRGERFPNIYALRPDYAHEVAAVARHAETLGVRKLAVLHAGDGESLAALESVRRNLPQLGTQLAAAEPISAGGAQKVLASAPESVLVLGGVRDAAHGVRQLRAGGFHRTIYVFSNAGESLLAAELGADGAGVVATRVVPGSDSLHTPIARELAAQALAAQLGRPNVYMMEGYLAAHVLATALRQASPEPTPARLRSAIEQMHDLDAGGFRIGYAKDRVASKVVELALIDSYGRVRD